MNQYEQKLQKYIDENNIQAQLLSFTQSCHSVAEAAEVVGATPQDFIKSICLITPDDKLIVAIVKGEDKVDRKKFAQHLGIDKAKIASSKQVLEKTGYPAGGVPPFGYTALFLIDDRVMEKDIVFAGGGSQTALIKVAPLAIIQATHGQIIKARI